MTYPPDDHLLRDLGVVSWTEADGIAFAELPVRAAALDSSGAVALGALATAMDVAAARAAFGVLHPDWIATADLSLAAGRRPSDGTVVVEARHVPSSSALVAFDLDLHGVGTGTATFVRIPRSASRVDRDLPGFGERSSMPQIVSAPPSIVGRMGFLDLGSGVVALAPGDYVSNSFGAITGGAVAYLVAEAAERSTGLVATDLMLRYLAQVKVGPAAASTRVIRSLPDHAVCEVAVHDAGLPDALLARATVTLVQR